MYLILGSKSPRRQEILEKAGFHFQVVPSDFDEKVFASTPEETVLKIAIKKCENVFKKVNNDDIVVLCADTIVVANGIVLNKPIDKYDSRRMINMIQGNTHQVLTAVAIKTKDKIDSFVERSFVTVEEMKYSEIEEYLKTGESYDKAGAYAIQGAFAKYVKNVDGDYYNVVGLPIQRVTEELNKYSLTKESLPIEEMKMPAEEIIEQPKKVLQCTACGKEVIEGAKFCFNCGKSIITSQVQECRNCHYENKIGVTYCIKCGIKINFSFALQDDECKICHHINPSGTQFCQKCGASTSKNNFSVGSYKNQELPRGEGLARTSLILGCIALPMSIMLAYFFSVPAIILAVIGIILGAKGLKTYRRGMALTGLILNIIALQIAILILYIAIQALY